MVGEVPQEIKYQTAVQSKEFDGGNNRVYKKGDRLRHKVFGEGIIEDVDEKTRTCFIRFTNGIKPISFDYKGLSHIF